MPRPRIRIVRPLNQWSPFPKKPPPFRFTDWRSGTYTGNRVVTKNKGPNDLPVTTPYKEWPILKGDLVEIMVGPDTGKQGKVRAVARLKNQLKVIDLNTSEQYMDDTGDGKAGYVLMETPLHYTEVKLVDPVTGKGTDVFLRDNNEVTGTETERVCKTTNNVIPKPLREGKWKDLSTAPEGDLDTKNDVVQQYTYMPSLLLFHEEIMLERNIPMSIPKTQPERRDLIMRELEEDMNKEIEEESNQAAEVAKLETTKSTFFLDQVKQFGSRVMFWKK